MTDPPRPQVAAFDFDGTLTTGGSVWPFLVEMVGDSRVAAAALRVAPKLVRAGLLDAEHADEAKEALFRRTLRGLPAREAEQKAAAFGLEHYRHHARQDVRERLEWHRRQGHLLVIVSASPDLYVRAVGEELRVDGVVATGLEVGPDGRLTGCYDGDNCRGPQKLEGLTNWMETSLGATHVGEGASTTRDAARRPFLWAYGNSAGDAPMLAAADVGIDVGRLGKLGKLRGFTRLKAAPTPPTPPTPA